MTSLQNFIADKSSNDTQKSGSKEVTNETSDNMDSTRITVPEENGNSKETRETKEVKEATETLATYWDLSSKTSNSLPNVTNKTGRL